MWMRTSSQNKVRQVRVRGGGVTFNPSLTEAAPLFLALAGEYRVAHFLSHSSTNNAAHALDKPINFGPAV